MSGPTPPPPPPPTSYNGSTRRVQINLMCYYFIVSLPCQSNVKSYFLRNTPNNNLHKLNVVLKLFALVINTTICMKQTTSARLGITGLRLNNSSVMNKFEELFISLYPSDAISLYPSDARVLSNHVFVGIHQVTICFEMHKLNVVLKFFALVFNTTHMYETNRVDSFRHHCVAT